MLSLCARSYQREQGEIYPDVTSFNSGAWEDEGYFEAPHLREGEFVQVQHAFCMCRSVTVIESINSWLSVSLQARSEALEPK